MNKLLLATLIVLIPGMAMAHPGIGGTFGLAAGFAHPIGGFDHVLVMAAIGLLAVTLGGRSTVLVPLSFLAVMVLGGALGWAGIAIPAVEFGIALSVVAVGGLIVFKSRIPASLAIAAAAMFAVFHGHAHGSEMPVGADVAGYMLGFVLATALLHAAGMALGASIHRLGSTYGTVGAGLVGSLITAAGVGMLAGVI